MPKLAFNINTNVMSPKTAENKVTLNRKDLIILNTSAGLAYVKDSEGRRDNLNLYISTYLNTKTNITESLRYSISAFNQNSPDYYNKVFKDYNEAVNEYDRLAIKFDGHRE